MSTLASTDTEIGDSSDARTLSFGAIIIHGSTAAPTHKADGR